MRILLLLAMCSVLVAVNSASLRKKNTLLRTLLKRLARREGDPQSGGTDDPSVSNDMTDSSADNSLSSSDSVEKPTIPPPISKDALPMWKSGSKGGNRYYMKNAEQMGGMDPAMGSAPAMGGMDPAMGDMYPGMGAAPGMGGMYPGMGAAPGMGGMDPAMGGMYPGMGVAPGMGGVDHAMGDMYPGMGAAPGMGGMDPAMGGMYPGMGAAPGIGGMVPAMGGMYPGMGAAPGMGGMVPAMGGMYPGMGAAPGMGGMYPGMGAAPGMGGRPPMGTAPGMCGGSGMSGGVPTMGGAPTMGSMGQNGLSFDQHQTENMLTNCLDVPFGKLDENTPVSIDEVKVSLDSIRQFAERMAAEFTGHSDVIVEFEESLEQTPGAPNLIEFVDHHRNLVTDFLELIRNSTDDGICSFASLGMIFNRLIFVGATHFDDSLCDKSFMALMEMDGVKQMGKIDESSLQMFGELIRNDMNCIINDIQEFKNQIVFVHDTVVDSGYSSLRDVELGLSSIEAYGSILKHEINHFIHAVKRIDDLQREYFAVDDSYSSPKSILQKYLDRA